MTEQNKKRKEYSDTPAISDEILHFYKQLRIDISAIEGTEQYYDTHTPYKKCGITQNVPFTVGNSTTVILEP